MNLTNRSWNESFVLPTLALMAILAGCGGGGDDDEPMETPPDPAASSSGGDNCNLALLFGANPNTACGRSSTPISPLPPPSGSPPPPPPISGPPAPPPPPPTNSRGLVFFDNAELEPNNELDSANNVRFAQSETDREGFKVEGAVTDVDDVYDYYVIARDKLDTFYFQLCSPGEYFCWQGAPIDQGTAFYEVLDQDGNVLKSSLDQESNNGMVTLEAGVVYYVRVVARDTMGATVGYSLVVYGMS